MNLKQNDTMKTSPNPDTTDQEKTREGFTAGTWAGLIAIALLLLALGISRSQIEELKATERTLSEERDGLQIDLKEETAARIALRGDLDATNESLAQSEDSNRRLSETVQAMDRQITTMTAKIKEQSEVFAAAEKQLKGEISNLTNLNSDLGQKLTALTKQADEQGKQIASLMKTTEGLQGELVASSEQNAKLAGANADLKKQVTDMGERTATLGKELESARADGSRLSAEKARLTSELASANEKRVAAEDRVKAAENEIIEAISERDSLAAEATWMREGFAAVEAEKQIMRNNNKSLVESISQLEAEIRNFAGAEKKNQEKLASLQNANAALEEMLRGAEQTNKQLNAQVAEAKSSAATAMGDRDRLQQEKVSVQRELDTARAQLTEANDPEIAAAMMALKSENGKLAESVTAMQDAISAKDAENQVLASTNEMLTENVARLESDNRTLEAQMSALEREVSALGQSLDELREAQAQPGERPNADASEADPAVEGIAYLFPSLHP
ncbi:MAG: hypothetical protein R3F11_00805 [Verrucomicrobiales bacterium]